MKKTDFTFRLLFAAPLLGALCSAIPAESHAQEASPATLHVIKSSVNADSDNAEFCLEFDQPLAPLSSAHLAAALRLEADGTAVTPQNTDITASSLCVFPLDRDKSYRISVAGLHGANNEKMSAPYTLSFTIPDRTPSLAFTGRNGNETFASYDEPLTLRAVNLAHAKLTIYRLTDPVAMARAWQDRGQTLLAPSESAYLARDKGRQIWESDNAFGPAKNTTVEHKIILADMIPDLAPGLYLIVADANDSAKTESGKNAGKDLAPIAATWMTKSDFSLQAVRDSDGIHAFTDLVAKPGMKTAVHLVVMNHKPEQLAEGQSGNDGIGLIPYPGHSANADDFATLIGTDAAGDVAFADIRTLPPLANLPALGMIGNSGLFAVPGDNIDLSLSLASPEDTPALASTSMLRLARNDTAYADFPAPPLVAGVAKLSFPAPASQGMWDLDWRKDDGTVLATAPLRVTMNADAPRLEITSDRDMVGGSDAWMVTVKSSTSTNKPNALAAGQLALAWQKLDPALVGWKNYQFGIPSDHLDKPVAVADFLTDFQGAAQLHLTLPPQPQEPGLYQIALTTLADADSGIANAKPLVLPLRPESIIVGIKPLGAAGHFAQNGLARFALIGLSSDGKPRDLSGLTYHIYEEGRSFAWYQDEGRWKYKPEPQLRPIGGGTLSIKADASSMLEVPVTAGNYRLEILDGNDKKLAQIPFSAGWKGSGQPVSTSASLPLSLPETLQPGTPTAAHVTLPQPSMLTVLIADTRIRKIVHERRPKGDNLVSFTPGADWQSGISLSVTADPQNGSDTLHAEAKAAITQPKPAVIDTGASDVVITAPDDPAALTLRAGGQATASLGIQNPGKTIETYHYVFTASPGLKIDGSGKGDFTLDGQQSRMLPVAISGEETGVKEIKLDIAGTHTPHVTRTWQVAVLAKDNFLHSAETLSVAPQQPLIANAAKARGPNDPVIAFVARRPMEGLAEILAYAFGIHPFTTQELALSVDALRLWEPTLAASGIAPDMVVAARRRQWLQQLLRRQNPDGGFSALRGGDSTMEDTAAALTALGPDKSPLATPARNLAIGWINQQLSNTWFDEKERAPRAAAYAALAAADAIDPASLHYFSDTSANDELPAIAEAQIAAAFKHIRDPNAAAFWIKKMLDAHSEPKPIALLGALAATDALSSDDVHTSMRDMVETLRKGEAPPVADVANLLRAITVDNADASDWRVTNGGQTHGVAGVMAVRLPDPVAAALRNGNAQALSVTYVTETERPPSEQPPGASVTRHVYRLNGVELSPQAHPGRNETYIVELKGALPAVTSDEQIMLHESAASALRPIGCPLSPHLDVPAFIPWFTPHDLTPAANCELLPHEFNVVLPPNADNSFNLVYFAHIDTPAAGDLAPPRLRILK